MMITSKWKFPGEKRSGPLLSLIRVCVRHEADTCVLQYVVGSADSSKWVARSAINQRESNETACPSNGLHV